MGVVVPRTEQSLEAIRQQRTAKQTALFLMPRDLVEMDLVTFLRSQCLIGGSRLSRVTGRMSMMEVWR